MCVAEIIIIFRTLASSYFFPHQSILYSIHNNYNSTLWSKDDTEVPNSQNHAKWEPKVTPNSDDVLQRQGFTILLSYCYLFCYFVIKDLILLLLLLLLKALLLLLVIQHSAWHRVSSQIMFWVFFLFNE